MADGPSRNNAKKGNSMLDDKIKSRKFNHSLIKELTGSDLKISYFQEHGFTIPVLVKDKSDLGLRLPNANISMSDIKLLIGSTHIVEVTTSASKESSPMPMKDLVRYFNSKECDSENGLSVACFEYSFTDLESVVDAPTIVTSIDWLYQAWPEHLVQKPHKDESASYPQLQRFCIMTVAGSFTDFHFDVGGTSVWYHVFRGHKIVWIIPPTNENCELFEKWCASSTKSNFFGDEVKSCQRFTLDAGSTLFIPSGWIHAVYSPVDSLTFSGNFLHSYAISEQLSSYELECRIKKISGFPFFCEMQWYLLERYVDTIGHVTHRAKYDCDTKQDIETSPESNRGRRPRGRGGFRRGAGRKFYNRVLRGNDAADDRFGKSVGPVKKASRLQNSSLTPGKRKSTRGGLGRGRRSALSSPLNSSSPSSGLTRGVSIKLDEKTAAADTPTTSVSMRKGKTRTHLCPSELSGLSKLVSFLEGLPVTDRHVPQDIPAPDELLHDAKVVIAGHAQDDPKLAVTGRPVLASWARQINFAGSDSKLTGMGDATESLVSPMKSCEDSGGQSAFHTPHAVGSASGCRSIGSPSSVRRRRVRCRKCAACTRSECGECSFCKDMKKFGGLGRMKQTCISRQCLAPMLPTAAVCVICSKLDAALSNNDEDSPNPLSQTSNSAMTLMECSVCWKIVHPQCLRESYPQLPHEGIINNDMPNSWECPKCCEMGGPKNAKADVNVNMKAMKQTCTTERDPEYSENERRKTRWQ